MCDSDRLYLSRFALDPDIESLWEDLYRSDISDEFTYDEEMDTFDDEKILGAEHTTPRKDFLFEN